MASPELADLRSGHVRRLRQLTKRSGRQAAGRFLVEGVQGVRESLLAHLDGQARVHEVVVSTAVIDGGHDVTALTHRANVRLTSASDEVVAALSETVTPQGIVAVVDHLDVPMRIAIHPGVHLVAVMADVRDPGNAGAALRVADAAGADAVIFAGDSVDAYNGKAVRAAVGGHFHLPFVVGVSVSDAVNALREAGLQVLVADGAADVQLDDLDHGGHGGGGGVLAGPCAWIFGNEAWGVPEPILGHADHAVGIPIYGQAESLNLATAVALCLYESARAQRGDLRQ